jgi:hypothetical protein
MTDTPERLRGSIRAFFNADKVPGDDKPSFTGKLTFPGEAQERGFALWLRRDKHGAVILSGQSLQVSGTAFDQIAALADAPGREAAEVNVGTDSSPLMLKARDIVLFENKNRGDNRPDFYGYHHTGDAARAPLQMAVWTRNDVNGRAYLTGLTQDRLPDKRQDEVADQTQDDMEPVA